MDDTLLTEMLWDKLLDDIEMREILKSTWDNQAEEDCTSHNYKPFEDPPGYHKSFN